MEQRKKSGFEAALLCGSKLYSKSGQPKEEMIPFMNMLYILDGYRGKGYGTELVLFWEKKMAKAGYSFVLTSTQSNEQAQFSYRKIGYTECGALLLPKEPLEMFFIKDLSQQIPVCREVNGNEKSKFEGGKSDGKGYVRPL